MISTNGTVVCPRCKRNETVPLAREDDRQRYQCQSCSENFWAPYVENKAEPVAEAPVTPRFSHVSIAVPEKSDVRSRYDVAPTLCKKCNKPYFNLGKRFDAHVANCSGVPYVVAKRRLKADAISALMAPDVSKVYQQSIDALKARRAALEAEIRGVDFAILEIEKLKGAGGPAPAPFATGNVPAPSSA